MSEKESSNLATLINSDRWDIDCSAFQSECKAQLDNDGVVVLPNFLTPSTVAQLQDEGRQQQHHAFYTNSTHNVYLQKNDEQLPLSHPRNQAITSSKGCITTDQIPDGSPLHRLYKSSRFKRFLCSVLDEKALYEYADRLSSINLHYASQGQELGWHFDNSSFAITLLIQQPEQGGVFEYVKDLRGLHDEWNFDGVGAVLRGEQSTHALEMEPGCLVLFRGRNALHRVTPTIGQTTRMLAVLAYNSEPDISLSESARMTFYGRV